MLSLKEFLFFRIDFNIYAVLILVYAFLMTIIFHEFFFYLVKKYFILYIIMYMRDKNVVFHI